MTWFAYNALILSAFPLVRLASFHDILEPSELADLASEDAMEDLS